MTGPPVREVTFLERVMLVFMPWYRPQHAAAREKIADAARRRAINARINAERYGK